MRNTVLFYSLCLVVGLVSCQSPEQKAAEARKKFYESVRAEKEKQLKELVDNTPDVYRVLWKVCGDQKLNLKSEINGGCDESREPSTEGFKEPVYVWGPAGEIRFFTKPSFLATTLEAGLFVKSKGCFDSGKPKEENFYKIRTFLVSRDKVPSPRDARTEVVPPQTKQEKLRIRLGTIEAQQNTGITPVGLIGSDHCQSLEEWNKEK